MTTASQPIRQMYEDYVAGRIAYEELRRRVDEASDKYLNSRGQLPGDSAEHAPRPEAEVGGGCQHGRWICLALRPGL